MSNNIKIIVSNVAEDEADADGLWDLAGTMAEIGDRYSTKIAQSLIYDELRELAIYTHPEHEDNREDEE